MPPTNKAPSVLLTPGTGTGSGSGTERRRPWVMCSEREAQERQRFKELSLLECTADTASSSLHPRHRRPDPWRCVKKYRRSAAGGGVVDANHGSTDVGDGTGDAGTDGDTGSGRSLEALEVTVEYLLCLFASTHDRHSDRNIDGNGNGNGNDVSVRLSLVKTVDFIDDRLRAVQVDLTTLLGNQIGLSSTSTNNSTNADANVWRRVRNIQAKLIRYNILCQHLLSDVSSNLYQWKFAQKALTTALASYFATLQQQQQQQQQQYQEDEEMDEIMSYAAMLHLSTILKHNETALPSTYTKTGQQCGLPLDHGTGISAMLGIYSKYISLVSSSSNRSSSSSSSISSGSKKQDTSNHHHGGIGKRFPKYQWALRIASAVDCGDYLTALRLLRPSTTTTATTTTNASQTMNPHARWRAISKCCVAQVLPLLRIALVRRYNKSFGKQELVPHSDLATLLHLPSPEAAISFSQSIGLPTQSKSKSRLSNPTASTAPSSSNHEAMPQNHDRIVMKAAPISITAQECIDKMTNPGRTEDWFIFGSESWYAKVVVDATQEATGVGAHHHHDDDDDDDDDLQDGRSSMRDKKKMTKKTKPNASPNKNSNATDPMAGMSSLQRAMMKLKVQNHHDDPNEIELDDEDDEHEDDNGGGDGYDYNNINADEDGAKNEKTVMDEDGVVLFPKQIILGLIL